MTAFETGDLRALRAKYERLLALREAHELARRARASPEPDPSAALAALARDFPGALREIDLLPLDVIVARIAAIEEVERRPEDAERWMLAQVVFHRHARRALAAKRWLAGRRQVTPAMAAEFAAGHEGAADLDLQTVATPPGGRLSSLAYAEVARALAIPHDEARALVMDGRFSRRAGR